MILNKNKKDNIIRKMLLNSIETVVFTKNEYFSSVYENLMHEIFMCNFKFEKLSKLIIMKDFLIKFLSHYYFAETKIHSYLKQIEFELQNRQETY